MKEASFDLYEILYTNYKNLAVCQNDQLLLIDSIDQILYEIKFPSPVPNSSDKILDIIIEKNNCKNYYMINEE